MNFSYSRIPSFEGQPTNIKDSKSLNIYTLNEQSKSGHSISYCTKKALENAIDEKSAYNFQTYPSTVWRRLTMYRLGNPTLSSYYKENLYEVLINWTKLDSSKQTNWITAFNKLGMYKLVNKLKSKTTITSEEMATAFALSENKINDYNISEIWIKAQSFNCPVSTQLVNLISIVVLSTKGKYKGVIDIAELEKVTGKFIKERLTDITDNYELSWFYRAIAMLPGARNDIVKMNAYMDLAEEYANKVDDKVMYLENIFPLLQSRSKEALVSGDFNTAISHLDKLITISPNDSLPYYQMANIYREIGKINCAIKYYKKSAEMCPTWDIHSMLCLADIYYNSGDYSKTITTLVDVIRNDAWCYSAIKQLKQLTDYMTSKEIKQINYILNRNNLNKQTKNNLDPIEEELILLS